MDRITQIRALQTQHTQLLDGLLTLQLTYDDSPGYLGNALNHCGRLDKCLAGLQRIENSQTQNNITP